MDPLLARHIARCNNAILPGNRLPFAIGAEIVGYLEPAFAAHVLAFPHVTRDGDTIRLDRDAAGDLPGIARALADQKLCRWRGEAFDVRGTPDGPVLTTIDRGALPRFGIMAHGVHVDGLVDTPEGKQLWIGRRARDKALDPGKLDNIVAGGVPAGLTAAQTLVKEAAEEAAIPADLARRAVFKGQITYSHERAEGLRRDLLHCYELDVPASFTPRAADGEMESFQLWPLARVGETLRHTDDVKFNVALVWIALLERHGLA
jgi:8-oxo-dGTP pyrophosphatase MutT (NUDIX family)